MKRSALAVLAVFVFATTAGCGARDDRAETIQTTNGSTADSKSEPKAKAPGYAAGAGLTQAQVDAALLTVADLPSGWTLGEANDEDSDDDKIEPAKCSELINSMGADEKDAAAEGERDFNKGGPFGTVMGVSISSYKDKVDGDKLKEVANAFGACSSFKGTDKDGGVSEYKVAPLSLANIGDHSLAMTMTVESEGFTIPINIYLVVVGHNTLSLYNGGIAGADGADLETIGKLAMKRLEEAAKH